MYGPIKDIVLLGFFLLLDVANPYMELLFPN